MTEKIALKGKDGTVLFVVHREPGRERFEFMPAFFKEFTREQWELFRHDFCESLGYPEEDIIAQEKEWGAEWGT